MKNLTNKWIEIESRLTSLEVNLLELKNNHLPHLEDKLDKLIWLVLGTLLTAFISLTIKFIK